MDKSLMLIVNPKAGRGSYRISFGDAMYVLAEGGYRTTLFFTRKRGDATRFAAQYAADYDTVACIGGDGTLSEVLAGLMQLAADRLLPHGYGKRRGNHTRPSQE